MQKGASEVLREIAISHLENKYGKIVINKKRTKEFWSFDGKIVRPYYFVNKNGTYFINALSENTVKNLIRENAYYMPIHYCAGNGKAFKVYCIHTDSIIEHYIDAGVVTRKAGDWHIKLRYKNNQLIFLRSGDAHDDVTISTDKNNYCLSFEMTDKEYEILKPLIPIKKCGQKKNNIALKVIVEDVNGSESFLKNAAKAIAIISVLAKSRKPLIMEEIFEGALFYGISTQEKKDFGSMKTVLNELLATGGIIASDGKYKISDSIKVEVTL